MLYLFQYIKVHSCLYFISFKFNKEDGLTLLMFACQLDRRVTAQKLIELGAAVNQRLSQRVRTKTGSR